MRVKIRNGKCLSEEIVIQRGTRQGGLTSPFLYNVYYKGMIDKLQECHHGVTIGKCCYNTFCYADDILLCSTTMTGLQELINIATDYVNQFGLRFNPARTICMTTEVICLQNHPNGL